MKPLGRTQQDVLRALREHGDWHGSGFGQGWVWDTASNTRRIMDSLVRRGVVTHDSETDVYRVAPQ